jgi:bifunctional ADP-heptose synthase (sugar kinase/adenylyltransferase)
MNPIPDPLTSECLETILRRLPALAVGVLGDLFLDRYLDLDASLTEPSVETGLDAYQVVNVRAYPGAAGTVVNNLAALGVGRINPIAIIGDDGEGYELRKELAALGVVDVAAVRTWDGRLTPSYVKPLMRRPGQPPRELNRLDMKNRRRLPREAEDVVLQDLDDVWEKVDALVVLDQVTEADCGVVTARVRERLARLGKERSETMILADSRARIAQFRGMALKPNARECLGSIRTASGDGDALALTAELLARQAGRPVFCTCGAEGMLLAVPWRGEPTVRLPAYPVPGPIDVTGAGDSASAGIVCAVAAGASLEQAAAFGCLVASITVQQIGKTGTATPDQVRQRWCDLRARGAAKEKAVRA